ncbi:MAG: aldose epimerase family protein [Formosimonas sp.]
MSIECFKRRMGAHEVDYVLLRNAQGMSVELMSWGATLVDVCVPDRAGRVESVTLAYDALNQYAANPSYFGCVVGRVAGRIAGSRFVLNGQTYDLPPNTGEHHLHGGAGSMSHQLWTTVLVDESSVRFEYVSPAGENGYPATLHVAVTYVLSADNMLSIRYHASADAPTLCNLTHHAYFNLSGNARRLMHEQRLQVSADAVCAMSDDLLVTGEEWPVDGSPFDFRAEQPLAQILRSTDPRVQLARGVDHYFVLNEQPSISLHDPVSGRRLRVRTDQPCVVLYAHNYAQNEALRHGVTGQAHDALCIETQKCPHQALPNGEHAAAIEPTQPYTQRTDFCFDVL